MRSLLARWVKLILLSIITTIVIVFFAATTYQVVTLGWEVIFSWHGWTMLTGVAAITAAMGVALLVIMSLHNSNNSSLEQAQLLLSLGRDINQSQRNYHEALIVLKGYHEPPGAMPEDEWYTVVGALRKCYESTSTLNQISFLIRIGWLDLDSLYSLHYKSLTSQVTNRLRLLLAWCDTGLELEAGYDLGQIKVFLISLKELVSKLENYHFSLKGQVNSAYQQEFQEIESALAEYDRYLNLNDNSTPPVPLNTCREEVPAT